MHECTAEGTQSYSPRASARTVLSPETSAAARDSAIQGHFLVLDMIAAAEDTVQSRMTDHTDGSETAAAGMKRMLHEHAGWPLDKRRKHEGRGVNPTNGLNLSIDPVPHPPVAKKPHKAYPRCEHQRRRSQCKDCGSSIICQHQWQRNSCKNFSGSSICEHQRRRRTCTDCGGSSLCEHQM